MRSIFATLIAAVVLFPLTANATDVEGDVWGTWTKDNSPYNVIGEVRVPPESSLVIEPGVFVVFKGHYKFIVDSMATLLAVGIEREPIHFTTVHHDTSWNGIRFTYADGNSQLRYCVLEYGKAFGSGLDNFGGAIYCYYSSPTISSNRIRSNSAYLGGGGIFCRGSSSTISNNTISGNLAYGVNSKGGGIYCVESSGTISNNTIIDNSANNNGSGGGIYCWKSNPTISYNTISRNWAYLYYGRGGGISCDKSSSPTVSNNVISDNWAYGYGGGIDCYDQSNPTIEYNTISGNFAYFHGGGIYCEDSSPTISNNTVHENEGCGIHCYYHSSPTISNNSIKGNLVSGATALGGGGICCEYHSSPTIRNNTIVGNSVDSYGGGILCTNFCYPAISNSSIWGNSAGYGGGIGCKYVSNPTITNTILWADTATSGPEVYLLNSEITITYSNVQGGWPGDGNIDADPIFAGPYNDDFYLRWHSPCIDAGDPDPHYNDPDGTRNDMGCFYFNQDVDGIVELYPHDEPIVIPPEGGDIIYDGWVYNFLGHRGRADIWTYAFVPEMGRYGPIDLYENVRISADSIGKNQITQHVPRVAPEGEYVFVAYVGEYPSTITDSSCFYFAKTGSIAGGIADWQSLKGWFDDLASAERSLPTHCSVSQNCPNPFNATTLINYQLPLDSHVKLEVYNTLGQKVTALVDERQEAGYKSVIWDASEVSSGLYFYKLIAGDFVEMKRMTLLK